MPYIMLVAQLQNPMELHVKKKNTIYISYLNNILMRQAMYV